MKKIHRQKLIDGINKMIKEQQENYDKRDKELDMSDAEIDILLK